jgi:hypothetical protein
MEMTAFHYVDFYDVPRTIIVPVRGQWVLLQSAFDEHFDDYEAYYSVYRLPSSFEPPTVGSRWDFLQHELVCVGKIPISEVEFDLSKRRTLRASALDAIAPD